MKILMVSEWHPLSIGGVQRHVRELSKILVDNGFEVAILTKSNNIMIRNGFNVPIYQVKSIIGNNYLFLPPNLQEVKLILKKFSPDIIHVHHAFTPTPLLTLHLADKMDIPKVLTNHTIISNNIDSLFSSMTCNGLKVLKYFLSKADYIISVSNCAARFIEKIIGDHANNIVIPNGVDVNKFYPSKINFNNQIILFVGRLVYRKGVHILLKAFSIVAREFSDVKLRIVGEGYMRGILQFLVQKYDLNNRVEFLGKVSEDKLPEIYREAKIVVIPSLFRESFGIVALEAMASGKPVIASNIGGLSEIIIDNYNGILIPPGDPELLADRIIELLNDDKLIFKMGFYGRRIAVEKYSWNIIVKRILEIYNELVSE